MGYSRKLGPPIVSAAVATIVLTNFAMATIVRSHNQGGFKLFEAIWPIALTSAVAVVLVMSFLYRSLLDMVQELESREASAQHAALHDQLTGLANRALLEDRLGQALGRWRRKGERVALLILDLDRFKQVNDTLGHNAGDLLVQQVAARLRGLLRESDTVARIGGDEFAIVQANPGGEADVRTLCNRILDSLREPFDLGGKEARVGVSIGAIIACDRDAEPAELLRKADITMYRAKSGGRDCYRIFSDEMDADVQRRNLIESSLHQALAPGAEGGIDYHFQPQLCSRGTVGGAEALLRWAHPLLGELTPGDVIPVAEECGLIEPLGDHAFRAACRAARRWPDLFVAVNLSPLQFRRPDLHLHLRRIAAEEDVECSRLELEITENLLIEHETLCERTIQLLRRDGFRVTLDDFGTGYSSLSYLRRFQVDKIKLDRAFIDAAERERSIAIIRAAVGLGRAMGLEVVAEGISTAEQEQVALEAGCDGLQGWLYGRPMPAADFDHFLTRRSGGIADAA
ncbi:MAG: putative bifunctional diguanylate cyclase/phosphodiesterase [Allosphingosinicella sp.]|uniref:putative bifunctional diguanylate cyclase/phosphodiesterase n=1 Tax=Allosphingosinicella sp. TaxID=2823234 RepID=UPI0039250680